MDPSSSSSHQSSLLSTPSGIDLSRHLWTAVAALAIAVPVQVWREYRRKSPPVVASAHNDPNNSLANRTVLNTIDEEDDELDGTRSLPSQDRLKLDSNDDDDPTPKSKRSRDRRKRGPNPLKERSSRARQRVASWSLAASSEVDKSVHAVTTLEPPPTFHAGKSQDKENYQKRDPSIASSSRTGTDSLYGDIDETASEEAANLPYDTANDQLPIIRAPSTSTTTSVSNGDSYLDNMSITSASISAPTSAIEASICSSALRDSSRTLTHANHEEIHSLGKSNHNPKSVRPEFKHPFNDPTSPSPTKAQTKIQSDEPRDLHNLAHPRPHFSHNLDSRSSTTSSPSRNYSPAPYNDKEKESNTVLYDSSTSNSIHNGSAPHSSGEPIVSLATQISSLRGALSASRQREDTLKAKCVRLTAELQEARWRLGLWSQAQAQSSAWVQQPIPPGGFGMWGYPSTAGPASAPHSHPMSPSIPSYQTSGPFPHQTWGLTPLRNFPNNQNREYSGDHEGGDEDEDERLEKSPVAEAILKRPGSFTRSRSRTGLTNDEFDNKENIEEDNSRKDLNQSVIPSPKQNGQQLSEDKPPAPKGKQSDREDQPSMDEIVFPSLLGG